VSAKRVLFVHHTSLAGGAERSLAELVSAIRAEDVEPTVVLPHDGPLAGMLSAADIPVRLIPMSRMKRTVNPFRIAMYLRSLTRGSRRLAGLAKEVGAEIIHSNSTVAHIYGGEAASKLGVPAVWHVRDVIPLGAMGGRMAKTATAAIAISDFVVRYLQGEGVEGDRIVKILNGIDLSATPEPEAAGRLRRATRRELEIHEESPVVGTISAIVPWKRPEDFVSAFERLIEREAELLGSAEVDLASHRPLRGLFIGSDITGDHPDLERRLRQRADAAGGERIVFAGWRDDVPKVLAALDVYVSTSVGEPFGRGVAEAMAAGLPVVARRSGAMEELVSDGETGRLAGESPAEFASATLDLLRDADLRRRMGEAARERAFSRFDIRRAASEVAALYGRLLSG